MWLVKLLIVLAVAYLAVVAVTYATQTQILFPTILATASGPPLPASAARLEVETPDGERLRGVHVRPVPDVAEERVVVLGFGVNWRPNSQRLAHVRDLVELI